MTTFDTPEASARAFAIITEKDPFRLIIRGHVLVEEALDEGINAAFLTARRLSSSDCILRVESGLLGRSS
jgi:hypothetical protein